MTATTATGPGRSGHTHRRETGSASPLAGLGLLVRLFGRISRRQIIIWILAFLMLVPASVAAMKEAYPDQESLQARAQLLDNPSAVLMTGPAFALEDYTFWAMVANELFLYVLLSAAIMSVLLTVRHTRGEEESGRLEMLRALTVGRFAPAVGALIIVAIANVAVGAAVAIGLLATGGPVADSLALGTATALTGLLFGGIAAVAAQITEHAGTASGLTLGLLAVSFLVRGIGDVIERDGSWLSWFSPLAWAQQTRLYVELRWWPLLLTAAAVAVLLMLAAELSRRRDLGAGLRAPRSGPALASPLLLSPGGLAQRLLTPMMVAWAIGLFLFALAFGALASSLEDMVGDIPALGEWVPIDLEDLTTSFAAVMLSMLALGPAGLIVAGTLRLRTEEVEGRLAGVLLSGSSRVGLALRWLLVVVIAASAVQVLLGLGVGLGVWQATGDTEWIGQLTVAGLAYLPAIILCGAIALALYGLRVQLAPLAWAVVIWSAVVLFLGGLLGLPDWASDLSPLYQVPLVPDADREAGPLVVMGVIAVVLTAAGLMGLRRRDLAGG